MKRRVVLFLFLAAGFCLLNVPFVRQAADQKGQKEQEVRYDADILAMSQEEKEQIRQEAEEYNSRLAQEEQYLTDGFAEPEDTDGKYQEMLNPLGNGLMGYVEIPSLDLCLPLYHGTRSETLEKGAGHLEGSSLPVGGGSTHAVISAHRGLPSSAMFMDLDQLKTGDYFILSVLGERLVYQIDQIRTVEPEETVDLLIQKGKDYVTLVTCTPFGINTRRLLVRGERVQEIPEENLQDTGTAGGWSRVLRIVFIISAAGIMIAGKVLLFPGKKRRGGGI